ncbi:glutamate cyclase domain-containing protein [Pseudoalteromonas sp. SSDWG2]|uniref:glutamate cyclase domain-containing protein n=1 Tax=Pseudoalteromonas sp. SSDWG2 TaxID=3139391 RepID=UPI003BA9884E
MHALTSEQQLSIDIENLLVARNLRGMAQVQKALSAGYVYRAAKILNDAHGEILISTGFPVIGTFETDGPVGAIALYNTLQQLGKKPVLVCGNPLYSKLQADFNCISLKVNDLEGAKKQALEIFEQHDIGCVLAIERPGLNAQGQYCNMRAEDISQYCASFDPFMNFAPCPSIAIGDGGNEIGMGNVIDALTQLDIIPSITRCDELIVADVSNWGAYALIALLAQWHQQDLLAQIRCTDIIAYLGKHGSVDGVTRRNEPTEDGLDLSQGEAVITQLRQLTGFCPKNEEKQ